MPEFVIGQRLQLSDGLLTAVSAYRYEVFVQRLGWVLPDCGAGVEHDAFDTEDTVYVVARMRSGQICGCGRLLPTTRPYLLKQVFPHLVNQVEALPCSRRVWELSRFAVGSVRDRSAQAQPPDLARSTFQCACRVVAERGGQQLVGVLTLAVERALLRFGARLERLGQPRLIDDQRLVACEVDVTQPFIDT